MRRVRSLREVKEKWHRDRLAAATQALKNKRDKVKKSKSKPKKIKDKEKIRKAILLRRRRAKRKKTSRVLDLHFKDYNDYKYDQKTLVVAHVIESLGVGGAQVMMMELVNGLNRYYPEGSQNLFVYLHGSNKRPAVKNKSLYMSYGISPTFCPKKDVGKFCAKNKVDIVLHHRISVSAPLRAKIPSDIRYIVLNHTWNRLTYMRRFENCDAYVSVCRFLHSKAPVPSSAQGKQVVILNGLENKYLEDIEPATLSGQFKTGRCHRLTSGKFNLSSLKWMAQMPSRIKGFHHHLIGGNKRAKAYCSDHSCLTYHGPIFDRNRKMSIIKDLDVYCYETYQPEGASMAILESLACGVPVLTRPLGGCPELIRDGVNGFLVKNKDSYKGKMVSLADQRKRTKLRASTVRDFDNRLHIRHAACKYMQLFEALT